VVGGIYNQNTLFATAVIFASIFRFASYVVLAMSPQILNRWEQSKLSKTKQ